MIFASDTGGLFRNATIQVLVTILVIVVIQVVIRDSIERVVARIVQSHKYANETEEHKREDTLTRIFRTASAVVLWTVGVIVILGELHVNLATLITGAGVIGVIIGIGAQSAIKDFLAGIFIIVENQYRVGDIVSLSTTTGGTDGVAGVVEDISIRITRLRDLDGNLHIVPNGLAGVITNLSFKFANVNVDVGVSYNSDIDKVERVMNEVGEKMMKEEPWKDNIIEPIKFLRLDNFGDSSITVKALGKVKPATQWDTAAEYRRRLKKAFEKEGIEIPFPQIVVHQPAKK
jgi:moderate conductance mechanosensitive channel